MAIFAFITGIILGASLIACTAAAHNSDEIDEIISAGLATAKLADNYATRLVNARNYITSTSDVEFDQHELLAIIDGREAEWQAIKK